jgi:hypothetical protein
MAARKETVVDLAKFIDKGVHVKLSGGREGALPLSLVAVARARLGCRLRWQPCRSAGGVLPQPRGCAGGGSCAAPAVRTAAAGPQAPAHSRAPRAPCPKPFSLARPAVLTAQ